MRRIRVAVSKKRTKDSGGFRIYFFKHSNIVISSYGDVTLRYDPSAEVTTTLLFEGKQYTLDNPALTVFIDDGKQNPVIESSKQDEPESEI